MSKKQKRDCSCGKLTNEQLRNYLSRPVTWISAVAIVVIDVIIQVVQHYF